MPQVTEHHDGPQPFCDASVEVQAQRTLNNLVLNLMGRTTQPVEQRARKLGNLAIVEDPYLAEHIMRHPAVFQKNFALVAALGNSRFNLNGARWEMFRDRTQPAYNRASRQTGRAGIAAHYDRAVKAFDPGDLDTVEPLLAKAAMSVFVDALGISPDISQIVDLFPQVRIHAKLLQYFSWNGIKEPEVLAQRANWLDQRFNTIFMDDPRSRDFVRQAIDGTQPGEWHPAITDLMQNAFAGAETTVATLCWAVRLMGQNRTLQDQLRIEARSGKADMPLLSSFMSEVMRCLPPIPFVVREATQAYEGHGVSYPAGQQIILSIIGLHKDPDAWSNPNQFHAARPEFAPSAPTPKAFRPFLSGPRVCGGKRLAELEMMSAMTAILNKWRFSTEMPDVDFEYALAMRPASFAGVSIEAV
jgi:cytochrome P450